MKIYTSFNWGLWAVGFVIEKLSVLKGELSGDDIDDWIRGNIYEVRLQLPLVAFYFYTKERYHE